MILSTHLAQNGQLIFISHSSKNTVFDNFHFSFRSSSRKSLLFGNSAASALQDVSGHGPVLSRAGRRWPARGAHKACEVAHFRGGDTEPVDARLFFQFGCTFVDNLDRVGSGALLPGRGCSMILYRIFVWNDLLPVVSASCRIMAQPPPSYPPLREAFCSCAVSCH